ncbi:MAG: hypothetical protein LBP73_07155 [Clostridiales Family XIII bacterium]|jgi:hypothetical protein|nr:hypothetical protein [Clostridiales Family XIII bacterium]
MEKTNLYIPVNIKTRFEFFEGYGTKELASTLAAALASAFLAFAVHALAGGVTAPVLIVLVTIAASVTALAKGEQNMSVLDRAKCVLRFVRGQREYAYRYTGEWGDGFETF